MNYAVFKGESSVSELVTRLFALTGKSPKIRETEEMLLQANPQLNELKKVAPGAILVIPSAAPALRPSQKAPESVYLQFSIYQQAQQTLDNIRQSLAPVETRAIEAARTFLDLAKSQKAQKAQKPARASLDIEKLIPGLAKQISNAVDDTQAIIKALTEQQKSNEEAYKEMKKRLTPPEFAAIK
jgi:hypothetical protein